LDTSNSLLDVKILCTVTEFEKIDRKIRKYFAMKIEENLSCPCTCHRSVLRVVDVDPLILKLDARGVLFASCPGRFIDEERASFTHGVRHWVVPRIHRQFYRNAIISFGDQIRLLTTGQALRPTIQLFSSRTDL
jgi:hypothetical protein